MSPNRRGQKKVLSVEWARDSDCLKLTPYSKFPQMSENVLHMSTINHSKERDVHKIMMSKHRTIGQSQKYNERYGKSLLNDVGDRIGFFLDFDYYNVINVLQKGCEQSYRKAHLMHSRVKKLLQYVLELPGFPSKNAAGTREHAFKSISQKDLHEATMKVTTTIKTILQQMNYCDSEQSIEIWLSYIYSLYECVQNSHYNIIPKK